MKSTFIPSLVTIACVFSALIFVCDSAGAQNRRESHFVSDGASHPIQFLSDLVSQLKQHPKVQRFRGERGTSGPHYGQGSILIYDRQNEVLWLENSWWSWGETEPDFTTYAEQTEKFLREKYFHVTPKKLENLLKIYAKRLDIQDNTNYYLPHLLKNGCTRQVLINRKKSWREKWFDNGKGGYWVKIR